MKKSLVAAAVLTAFAGSAFAANVTLYGVVDLSLLYTRVDTDLSDADAVNKLELKSGNQAGSRWGLKGSEKINDDLDVSFILESGFTADDGALDAGGNRLFRREATLSLSGKSWGKLTFGRLGAINQGVGSWGKGGTVSAFGTSWSATYAIQASQVTVNGGVNDNTIAYQTPKFAGLTGYVQYSTGTSLGNSVKTAEDASNNRYGAIGLSYENGPFNAILAADYVNYATAGVSGDVDDGYSILIGGNYDFGVAKVFFGAQYFENRQLSVTGSSSTANTFGYNQYMDGYGVLLSVSAPIAGGKLMAGVGYLDASEADNSVYDSMDFKRYVVSVGYDYSLSKRTNVYGVIGYQKDDYEFNGDEDYAAKPSALGVTVGIRHRF